MSINCRAAFNPSQIDTFYFRLYNYQFKSADSLLKHIVCEENDQGLVDLLYITYDWWLIISGETEEKGVEILQKKIDYSIENLKKLNGARKLPQDKLFQLIVMYSYKSRVLNLQHNLLSSFSAYKSSLDYFEELIPCEKVSCDMYNFVAGMYYSLGGLMKEQYPGLFFIGMDDQYANREKGYSLLSLGISSGNLQVQTESIYFFMKLYSDLENKPVQALRYSEMLIQKYPDNLVFRFNQLKLLKAQDFSDRMRKEFMILEERASKNIQLTEKQRKHFLVEYHQLN